MLRRILQLATVVLCFANSGLAAAAVISESDDLRIIVVTLDQAPGTPDGVFFQYRYSGIGLFRPAINNSGQLAFYGQLNGPGIDDSNDAGIWSGLEDNLRLVAQAGDRAPGTPEGVYFGRAFGNPFIDAAGRTAFTSDLVGASVSSTNEVGLWSESGGSLHLVARQDQIAPGVLDGARFDRFLVQEVSDSGDLILRAELRGTGVDSFNDSGIWVERGGALELLVRDGQPAPDEDPGVVISGIGFPHVNRAGLVVFAGEVSGPNINVSNRSRIWAETPQGLRVVAREGDPVPGMPPPIQFTDIREVNSLNDAGQTTYFAELGEAGNPSSEFNSLWSEGGGTLHPIIFEDDPVPGGPPGSKIGLSSSAYPVINNRGDVLFRAFVQHDAGLGISSANDEGYWIERNGSVELLVREDEQAPGFADGVVFDRIQDPAPFYAILNENSQVAFTARLSGPGIVENVNSRSLWVHDSNSELRLIAQQGMQVEVAPGDIRTITSIELVDQLNSDEGNRKAFNDIGQIAFRVRFDGGNRGALLVSNLVAIPEPSTVVLTALGLVGMMFLIALGRPRRGPSRG